MHWSCSPSPLSLQVGAGVRGPEQHNANQACDPDPVSGVCPVSAPPQPERGPHRPGRLLHRTGQGGPFFCRDSHASDGLDSDLTPSRVLHTCVLLPLSPHLKQRGLAVLSPGMAPVLGGQPHTKACASPRELGCQLALGAGSWPPLSCFPSCCTTGLGALPEGVDRAGADLLQ